MSTGNDLWYQTELDKTRLSKLITAANLYEQTFPAGQAPAFLTDYYRRCKRDLNAYRVQLRLWLDNHPDRSTAVANTFADPSSPEEDAGMGATTRSPMSGLSAHYSSECRDPCAWCIDSDDSSSSSQQDRQGIHEWATCQRHFIRHPDEPADVCHNCGRRDACPHFVEKTRGGFEYCAVCGISKSAFSTGPARPVGMDWE